MEARQIHTHLAFEDLKQNSCETQKYAIYENIYVKPEMSSCIQFQLLYAPTAEFFC